MGPHHSSTADAAVRRKDLRIAAAAVGDTDAARLAWLVAFARDDAGHWHSADYARQGDGLLVVAYRGAAGIERAAPLTRTDVMAIHRVVRQKLLALVRGRAGTVVRFPDTGTRQGLIRLTEVGVGPAVFESPVTRVSVQDAVLLVLRDLVLRAGDRLMACPRCFEPFLKVHKQIYCTPACAQRARNDRKAGRDR